MSLAGHDNDIYKLSAIKPSFGGKFYYLINVKYMWIHGTCEMGNLTCEVIYFVSALTFIGGFCYGDWATITWAICLCVFALWIQQETAIGFLIRQTRGVPPPHRFVFVCSKHPNYHYLLLQWLHRCSGFEEPFLLTRSSLIYFVCTWGAGGLGY